MSRHNSSRLSGYLLVFSGLVGVVTLVGFIPDTGAITGVTSLKLFEFLLFGTTAIGIAVTGLAISHTLSNDPQQHRLSTVPGVVVVVIGFIITAGAFSVFSGGQGEESARILAPTAKAVGTVVGGAFIIGGGWSARRERVQLSGVVLVLVGALGVFAGIVQSGVLVIGPFELFAGVVLVPLSVLPLVRYWPAQT
jgi:hypothetical protein